MHHGSLDDAPIGRLLGIAGHLATQRWNRYLAEQHGLTGAGMAALLALHRHGELTHRALADHCFVRPATATGIIDTLERDGLVERRRSDTDRRTIRLALTQAGTDRMATIVRLVDTNAPLTSVDADPANAAVIRRFLLELIQTMSCGEDTTLTQPHRPTDPGSDRC
ncbi:MarR family winged helix-turn-helix transcriptional regulator [Micromonospora echinofusca]|uniref:MarR family transcriptional regulator n=1 Tax=Micromonospora echinofusca TaxID=47858 RepID=A0ABS3VR91_MICEH|nr:MarR family winged helix-turn-helix transcriptional regulator [Micromonospora echinofusca]MBO4206914.1 MarR family transcriptional regulator [Micromonospora echinofusca]